MINLPVPFPDNGKILFDLEVRVRGILPDGTDQEFTIQILQSQQAKPFTLSEIGTYLQREVYECFRILASNLQRKPE